MAQPIWGSYGGNPQHTALSSVAAQRMKAILWTTPVDQNPPYSGTDLFIHYGCPLVSQANNIIVTVRTAASSGSGNSSSSTDFFQVEAHDPGTGSTLYIQSTDYVEPSHDWILSCGSAIGPDNKLYTPADGGTILVRSNADDANGTVSRICFYGLSNYTANQSTFSSSVKIVTPLTVDASGNLYFGYDVFGSTPGVSGLTSGLAKIAADGTASWINFADATGLSGEQPGYNCAPAVTTDDAYVYMSANGNQNRLLRFNASDGSNADLIGTLQNSAACHIPGSSTTDYVHSDGTSCPLIAPDGTVFYGTWYFNHYRGFMHHFSADLGTEYLPSAFGWDDTGSIVPASCVPSYSGNSSYLLLTKYNNYADGGVGDGQNKLAILDPSTTSAGQSYVDSGLSGYGFTFTGMPEVQTLLGQTPNPNLAGVDEWCINTAAIDPIGKCAIINSEDGHAYRWDLTTNTVVDNLNLATPTGEAYTPTVIAGEGLTLAVNNAQLNVMWDNAGVASLAAPSVVGGNTATVTINLSNPATGPGALIHLTSSDPTNFPVPSTVTVPNGSSSVSFSVSTPVTDSGASATITATRYTSTHSVLLTAASSKINLLSLSQQNINGYGEPTSCNAVVGLAASAPTAGRTITFSSDISSVHFTPSSKQIASGSSSGSVVVSSDGVASKQVGHITATDDLGTSVTRSFTVDAPLLRTLVLSSTTVTGGNNDNETVSIGGFFPTSGVTANMTYSAHTSGPATIIVGSGGGSGLLSNTGTVTTPTVTTSYSETISASFGGNTATAQITIIPVVDLSGIAANTNPVVSTHTTVATITLTAPAPTGGKSVALSGDASLTFPSSVTIPANNSSATVTVGTKQVSSVTHATLNAKLGTTTKSVSIEIDPVFISSWTLDKTTATIGDVIHGTVVLTNTAGSIPIKVQIFTSPGQFKTWSIATPAGGYVNVPAGSNTVTVSMTVTAVSTPVKAPLYASLSGGTFVQYVNLVPGG